MNKKKILFLIIILLILMIIFIALKYFFPCCTLFDYNLMDVLTVVVVSLGLYFITEMNDEKTKRNDKIENIINNLKFKFNSVFSLPIKSTKKSEYLYTFKYIDNKIKVLSIFSKHLKCSEEINKLVDIKERLDEFINDNIGQGDAYFNRKEVKDKIPNYLCDIETQLDDIILKLYR